jgi:hypothetical protein
MDVIFTKISIISATFSAFFIVIASYAIIRMAMMQKKQSMHRDFLIKQYSDKITENSKNPKWELVENLVTSPAEADWRVAIIEADVMLEDVLQSSGFSGQGIGEMLTNANPKSFSTYQYAWDAHKIRNNIAHLGSSYKITKDDALRTINMYKGVLEEFGVI